MYTLTHTHTHTHTHTYTDTKSKIPQGEISVLTLSNERGEVYKYMNGYIRPKYILYTNRACAWEITTFLKQRSLKLKVEHNSIP